MTALLPGDPDRAVRITLALGAAVERVSADAETRALAERTVAEALLFTGRLDAARDAFGAATRHARDAGNKELLGQVLVGRIGVLTLTGRTGGVGRLASEARRILEETGDLPYLARLHLSLGNAHYQAERYRRAVEEYERGFRYSQAAGETGATWIGLRLSQAVACTRLYRLAEAESLFGDASEQARQLGLSRLEAQAQFNRASLEVLRGDYRQALSHLEKAESTFDEQGVPDMRAASSLALSELYNELAMPSEALDLARSASEAFRSAGMEHDARLARFAAARSLLLAGRPVEALPLLEECREFYRSENNRLRLAEVQLALARVCLTLGQHGESGRTAREALQTFQSLGMRQFAARARCRLAEALLAGGALAEAGEAIGPAIRHARTLQVGVQFEVWLLAGRISRRRGRRRESLGRLRKAVGCLEDQRRLVPGLEIRSRVFDSQVTAYHDLIGLLIESGKPRVSSVFPLVEAARARGFRERLRLRAAADPSPATAESLDASEFGKAGGSSPRSRIESVSDTELPPEIVAKRTLLGSLSRRLESLEFGDAHPRDRDERARLQRTILSLEKSIARRVRRWEAIEAHRHAPSSSTLTWDRLLHRIRSDETVVEYFVVEGSILAIVLSRDRARLRVLPASPEPVQAATDSLRHHLDLLSATVHEPVGTEEFHLQAARADLQSLYRLLLEPLHGFLSEKGRLTIVPHSFLHLVPFECLHDGVRYVDERWIISRSPTADHLIAPRPALRPGRAVIAGMVRGGPPSVRREIDSVAAFFSEPDRHVLLDPTPAELIEAMAGAEIVHISTHAFFREDNPVFSRLSLRGGALFLADILQLRLRPGLVVLSACNTGRVFTGKGDDLSGVAHGFLAAGARQLVASNWRVHDAATEEWMRAFYGSLTGDAHGDCGLALNRANRDVRRLRAHPFYWGGFSLYGA